MQTIDRKTTKMLRVPQSATANAVYNGNNSQACLSGRIMIRLRE